MLADGPVSKTSSTTTSQSLTLDALVVHLCAGMSLSQNPVAITSHVLMQDITVFGVDDILQNHHSILMQSLQGHLKPWDGVGAILEICFRQRHTSWPVGFGVFQDGGRHDGRG